jgi:hypothetical protein
VNSLTLSLRAVGNRPEVAEILENFVGQARAQSGGMKNVHALDVLTQGFKRLDGGTGPPPVRYLASKRGGGPLRLPSMLSEVRATLLAPSRSPKFISMLDPPTGHHYLAPARAADGGQQGDAKLAPFGEEWRVAATRHLMNCWPPDLKDALTAVLPDDLEGLARWLEDALNNTSIVVHFSLRGKNLLFAGDAQWGSWLSWMYEGGDTARGLSALSRDLLAELDFLKIAHHGSVNATPPEVVANLARSAAVMCSTNPTTTYPRVPLPLLLEAIEERTTNRLALSDQIEIENNDRAHQDLRKRPLPSGYESGAFWIDCIL